MTRQPLKNEFRYTMLLGITQKFHELIEKSPNKSPAEKLVAALNHLSLQTIEKQKISKAITSDLNDHVSITD